MPPDRRTGFIAVLVFLLIAAVLLVLGFAYYQAEMEEIAGEKDEALAAISGLKSNQIVQWRKERAREADRSAKSIRILNLLMELQRSPDSRDIRESLREKLKFEMRGDEHADALIFDREMRLLVSAGDHDEPAGPATRQAVLTAFSAPGSIISDFFRSPGGPIQIDAASAVRDPDGEPLAVLVLRSRADAYLYPLIQAWPVSGLRAESFLVERDGKDALYLNELRSDPRSALRLRVPLAATNDPAVQAVLGRSGFFEGEDGRGTCVLSDLRHIPDTRWSIVTLLDGAEMKAEARQRAGAISLIIGLLILLAAALVALLFRHRQARLSMSLLHAEQRTAEARETYRWLFESMLDGFALVEIICDADGTPADCRYLSVNPAFERMTGLKAADVVGRTIKTVLPAIESGLIERYGRVARTGEGEEFEAYSKSLERHFKIMAFCPQPGCVGVVFDDITGHIAAEEKYQQLSRLYAALSDCSQAIVHSSGPDELMPKICRDVVEHGGMKMAWIGMFDPATQLLRFAAGYGAGADFLNGMPVSTDPSHPSGRSPAAIAIRENKPVWCQDFLNDPATVPWHEAGTKYGWQSVAAIPLRRAGKVIGSLNIHSDKSTTFIEDVRKLAIEMAEEISFAMDSFAREDDRKRVKETLAHVINSVPQSVFWKDLRSVYLGCNEVFARVAGLATVDEVVGKTDFDLPWTPQETEAYIADDREVMEGNRAKRHIIEPLRQADGSCLWIDTTKVPLADSGGRIYGVLGVFEDITARKLAEEELQTLRAAVEQSANAIVITDAAGTIEYVNPAFEKITGYSTAEAIGKNPSVLNSGEQPGSFYRTLWATITSGNIWRGQFHNRRKDGTLYWETATISPVHNEAGKIVHFIAIKEDVTDRKSLESDLREALDHAEAGNRAKSEFLAVMSHELRTPLNGVLGYAELLSYSRLDDEQRDYAQTIMKSGDHLLQVVNDILDFSSIDKGSMKFEVAPILVADLLETSCLPLRKPAADKGLEFRCISEPGVPDRIAGDAHRIRQILINLLGNAVKFTSKGSISLRVASLTGRHRQFVVFSVEDTGIGISPATISRLFRPFMQGDSTFRRSFEGTGLGLAISQRLADAMGGSISVTSTPGAGSTFALYLPLGPCAAGGGGTPAASDRMLPIPCTTRISDHPVLVVEDDPDNSSLAGKMLQALGHEAEFAANGLQAVEAFIPGKYAAILMDMRMPVLDGLEATRRIRASEAGTTNHVPIIALTANVMPSDRERCLAAGMDDFLSKPFSKAGLASKLESNLQ